MPKILQDKQHTYIYQSAHHHQKKTPRTYPVERSLVCTTLSLVKRAAMIIDRFLDPASISTATKPATA